MAVSNQPDTTDINEFMSVTARDNDIKELDDFMSVGASEPDATVDDFLSISTIKPKGKKAEVKKTILSPEAQTKALKILSGVADIFKNSSNSLRTEVEKLIFSSADDVQQQQTQGYLENLKKRMSRLDITKVLMTPAGQYYARLGELIPTPSMVIEKFAPKAFELPENWEATYPPWITSFIKFSGGEPNPVIYKLIMMGTVDMLAYGGFNKILGKIVPAISKLDPSAPEYAAAGEAVRKDIVQLQSMTPEGLVIYNRELAASESATLAAINRDMDLYANVTLDQKFEINNPYANDNVVVNGLKVSMADGNGSVPKVIKPATAMDELISRKKTALEVETAIQNGPLRKDATIEEVFGKPGTPSVEWTPGMRLNRTTAVALSPWNWARPVFDEVSLHKQTLHSLRSWFKGVNQPFKGVFTKEQFIALGKIHEKREGYEAVLKNFGKIFGDKADAATKALEAYRTGWKHWADLQGLPPELRQENYMTHVVEFFKNRELQLPPDLEHIVKNSDKYLRPRMGSKEYNLDIDEAWEIYSEWAANRISKDRHVDNIMASADRLIKIKPELGPRAGDPLGPVYTYIYNYFGELKEFKGLKSVTESIGKTLSDVLIANSLTTPLNNIVGGSYLAITDIGPYKWGRGLKLAAKASMGTDAEAIRLQKIWKDSGFDELSNEAFYRSGGSVLDREIKKTLGYGALKKIDDFSFAGMRATELFNKKSHYLSVYVDTENIANKVIKNPGKYMRLEQFLAESGIDIPGIMRGQKSLDTEIYKYAHFRTVKVHQDYGKAGMTQLNMIPGTDILMRVGNFTFRAGEKIADDAIKATKYIHRGLSSKDPLMLKTALTMPETLSALRFWTSSLLLTAAANKAGINVDRIVGIENFIMSSSPLFGVVNMIQKGIKAYEEHDPAWINKSLRAALSVVGFKLTAPVFQLSRLFETANANRNNYSGKWKVYSGDSRLRTTDVIAEVDPIWYVFSMLSPIRMNNMDDYYKFIRDNAKKQRIISNLHKQEEISRKVGEYKDAENLRMRTRKFELEQRDEKRKYESKHPDTRFK